MMDAMNSKPLAGYRGGSLSSHPRFFNFSIFGWFITVVLKKSRNLVKELSKELSIRCGFFMKIVSSWSLVLR